MSSSEIGMIIFSLGSAVPLLMVFISSIFLDFYCFRDTHSFWVFITPLEAYNWASKQGQDDPSVLFWRKGFKIGMIAWLSIMAMMLIIGLVKILI